jgi:hypothetical protein
MTRKINYIIFAFFITFLTLTLLTQFLYIFSINEYSDLIFHAVPNEKYNDLPIQDLTNPMMKEFFDHASNLLAKSDFCIQELPSLNSEQKIKEIQQIMMLMSNLSNFDINTLPVEYINHAKLIKNLVLNQAKTAISLLSEYDYKNLFPNKY